MGTGAVRLEDSNGHETSNPTEAQIRETITTLGSGIEHCILHLGDDSFVQTAGQQDRLLLEYADNKGHFQSRKTDFDGPTVVKIFVDAMNGNDSWKTEYNFSRSGGPAGAGGAADAGGGESGRGAAADAGAGESGSGGRSGASVGGNLKNKVIGQVKREVGREASYGLNSVIRRVMRTIFGGRRF